MQPTPEPAPEPEPLSKEALKPAPSRRKKDINIMPEAALPEIHKRRRSARLSADKEQLEAQPEVLQPKRVKKSAPVEKKKQVTPAPEPETAGKSVVPNLTVQTPKQNELHATKNHDGGATKIMLPFADTPVITRNKEMRKGSKDGHRRSSTGMRGRRASSLMDSGLSNGKLAQHFTLGNGIENLNPYELWVAERVEKLTMCVSITTLRSRSS